MLTISEEKMEEIRDQIERLNRLPENDDFELVIESFTALERVIRRWRRWHLKKNQPKNYIRFTETRFKAISSGSCDILKVQVWGKNKLISDYRISLDVYLTAIKAYNLDPKNWGNGFWSSEYKPHVQ